MAEGTLVDTDLLAVAATDEGERDLQLFSKSQGLDLNGVRHSFIRAAL